MTESLKKKCDLFIQNHTVISKKFMFEKALMSIAAGLIFTGADREADVEKMAECRKILNEHTGVFSEYRDIVKLALISEMAMSDEPEQYIEDVKAVYKKLHKGKFKDNSYMILAAMLICDLGEQESTDDIIEKNSEIMKQMNDEHPILTSSDDISYTILLALSDRDVDAVLSDMNECYDYLKKTCKVKTSSDSIQGLSEILALTDGDIKEKCDKIVAVYDILNENKAETDGLVFSALGTLTGVDEAPEILANEIIEADRFLKEYKGFGEKSDEKAQRLMFAVILTAESYGTSIAVVSNSFINSTLSIIKAKQLAAKISIITQLLPSVLGAVSDNDNSSSGESKK